MTDLKQLETKIKELEERVEKLEGKEPLYEDAKRLVIKHHKATLGFLQRHLLIDFDRAAKILDRLKKEGLLTDELPPYHAHTVTVHR